MMRRVISRLVAGESLSEEEARQAMDCIMSGEATPAQIAAFLTALRIKGETVEEISGFARSMRQKAVPLVTRHLFCLDTCGTGGDGKQTFNISTAAAFVLAGGGIPVAKHGNRSVSSRCGSADVLEALGVQVDLSAEAAAACLDAVGISFLFAPAFHGAMKYAAGPRREIGIRTAFNLLGPLTNPAGAVYQVAGVYAPELTEVVAEVLGRLGSRRAYVVHGSDGMDEVTLSGSTKVTELNEGRIRTFYVEPEDAGLPRAELQEVRGGDAAENARIILDVLCGKPGVARDIVLFNAAFGFMAAGMADDVREGVRLAAVSIDSGAALGKLEEMRAFTRSWAA
ncbi:MAG: anthranilate phosphoribosyltransferase [Clostridia bacterium]|nr:anthranilate phosphoribosyltransferase [Clostridia bacterium]